MQKYPEIAKFKEEIERESKPENKKMLSNMTNIMQNALKSTSEVEKIKACEA
jgi:hypothetical protein